MTFPDDSIHSAIQPSPWWEEYDLQELQRGALVSAFVPHVDQVPYTIVPKGRKVEDEHTVADYELAPLNVKKSNRPTDLPVAAVPLFDREVLTGYRAKKRPCLIFSLQSQIVENDHRRGMPKRLTAPVVLAAPYYGADKDGTRAGYNTELVDRIRHAVYPQFFIDSLPIASGPKESILRLDHLQPIGTHYLSYEPSGFKLSEDALEVMDEWLTWHIFESLPDEMDGFIRSFQSYVEEHY